MVWRWRQAYNRPRTWTTHHRLGLEADKLRDSLGLEVLNSLLSCLLLGCIFDNICTCVGAWRTPKIETPRTCDITASTEGASNASPHDQTTERRLVPLLQVSFQQVERTRVQSDTPRFSVSAVPTCLCREHLTSLVDSGCRSEPSHSIQITQVPVRGKIRSGVAPTVRPVATNALPRRPLARWKSCDEQLERSSVQLLPVRFEVSACAMSWPA